MGPGACGGAGRIGNGSVRARVSTHGKLIYTRLWLPIRVSTASRRTARRWGASPRRRSGCWNTACTRSSRRTCRLPVLRLVTQAWCSHCAALCSCCAVLCCAVLCCAAAAAAGRRVPAGPDARACWAAGGVAGVALALRCAGARTVSTASTIPSRLPCTAVCSRCVPPPCAITVTQVQQ